jgi:hypothetical protein
MNITGHDIVKELEEEGSNLSWEAAETIRILRRALDAQIAYTNAIRDNCEKKHG